MASSFDRWEKDPFFSAAEEVQESADRMESSYRTWIHAKNDASSLWNAEELRRDLHTALGTTKWQLEEFDRAVKSSYVFISSDDARDRHKEFITAIDNQISNIENSLQEFGLSESKASPEWVCLDEGECNELALFLSGPPLNGDNPSLPNSCMDEKLAKPEEMDTKQPTQSSMDPYPSTMLGLSGNGVEKPHGHRRTASANAEIGTWKIAVSDGDYSESISTRTLELPPRKVPSFSGFLSTMEYASKLKLPKNAFRKWKNTVHREELSTPSFLQPPSSSRGINACFQKSKNCLDNGDNCYDKQLYGWYGAIQRQLQRSQYQMQYTHPIQAIFWVLLILCLVVLLVVRAI